MDDGSEQGGTAGSDRYPPPQKRTTRAALIAGWSLVRNSWAVLSGAPSLLLPPLAALGLSAIAVGLDIVAWGGVDEAFEGNVFLVAAKSLPLLIVVHSVAVLSEAIIVGAARMRLAGGDAGLDEGWRVGSRRIHTLVGYGMLRALERALTFLLSALRQPGRWLADLIDAAWDFATFLVVPVILFEEPQGPVSAVRRSATSSGLAGELSLRRRRRWASSSSWFFFRSLESAPSLAASDSGPQAPEASSSPDSSHSTSPHQLSRLSFPPRSIDTCIRVLPRLVSVRTS